MNIEEILKKVHSVCKYISDNDSSVWNTSEWNICSHIQHRLKDEFSDYDIDVELIKHNRRRPDIVVHKRGNNTDNFIVFQVKKDPTLKDVQDDLDKINNTFFKKPYCYKLGIFISIGKLPIPLPKFNTDKIGIIEVHGWVLDKNRNDDKNEYSL
jgi:hypothetical protein